MQWKIMEFNKKVINTIKTASKGAQKDAMPKKKTHKISWAVLRQAQNIFTRSPLSSYYLAPNYRQRCGRAVTTVASLGSGRGRSIVALWSLSRRCFVHRSPARPCSETVSFITTKKSEWGRGGVWRVLDCLRRVVGQLHHFSSALRPS